MWQEYGQAVAAPRVWVPATGKAVGAVYSFVVEPFGWYGGWVPDEGCPFGGHGASCLLHGLGSQFGRRLILPLPAMYFFTR